VINPKPLSALNHFTLPVLTVFSLALFPEHKNNISHFNLLGGTLERLKNNPSKNPTIAQNSNNARNKYYFLKNY
jgi:hypothetical protein